MSLTKEDKLLIFLNSFNNIGTDIFDAVLDSKKELIKFIMNTEDFKDIIEDRSEGEIYTSTMLFVCYNLRNIINEIISEKEMQEILIMDAREILNNDTI